MTEALSLSLAVGEEPFVQGVEPRDATPEAAEALLVSLAGLDVSLTLSGVLPGGLRAEISRRPISSIAPPLHLHLTLHEGPPPSFDRQTLQRAGSGFVCRGDGLFGTVHEAEARLEVFGTLHAALSALRLACALWLAPRGGLLLHGACIEVGGLALGLCGPSGAGKTTLSRRLLSRGVRVVSDEVLCAQGLVVHGHPFPRRLGDGLTPPGGLPLRALGFLSHSAPGAEPSVTRFSAAQAARALLARVFLPVKDAHLLKLVLSSVEHLSRTVPAWALALPDDERAASAALSLIGSDA